MADQYEIDSAVARLKIVRYLLSKADERGTTHGEKHHVIFVALGEIGGALRDLGDGNSSRYDTTDPRDVIRKSPADIEF